MNKLQILIFIAALALSLVVIYVPNPFKSRKKVDYKK
jgi:hypothetical protein